MWRKHKREKLKIIELNKYTWGVWSDDLLIRLNNRFLYLWIEKLYSLTETSYGVTNSCNNV